MGKHTAGSSEQSTMQAILNKNRRDKGTPNYQGTHRAEAGSDTKDTGIRDGRGRIIRDVK